ncbi:glycoside hydrolase family 7 protein [Ramaria rubella]|nr:glycoside hydrolase family 7 protein [Ramaria rubella]
MGTVWMARHGTGWGRVAPSSRGCVGDGDSVGCNRGHAWVAGRANIEASAKDMNAGTGMYDTFCNEIDTEKANFVPSISSVYNPDPASFKVRLAATSVVTWLITMAEFVTKTILTSMHSAWVTLLSGGQGSTVTIVTQSLTTGTLSEICHLYVQNGKTIQNAQMSVNRKLCDSITDNLCIDNKITFSYQLKAQGSLGSSVVHAASSTVTTPPLQLQCLLPLHEEVVPPSSMVNAVVKDVLDLRFALAAPCVPWCRVL